MNIYTDAQRDIFQKMEGNVESLLSDMPSVEKQIKFLKKEHGEKERLFKKRHEEFLKRKAENSKQ